MPYAARSRASARPMSRMAETFSSTDATKREPEGDLPAGDRARQRAAGGGHGARAWPRPRGGYGRAVAKSAVMITTSPPLNAPGAALRWIAETPISCQVALRRLARWGALPAQ